MLHVAFGWTSQSVWLSSTFLYYMLGRPIVNSFPNFSCSCLHVSLHNVWPFFIHKVPFSMLLRFGPAQDSVQLSLTFSCTLGCHIINSFPNFSYSCLHVSFLHNVWPFLFRRLKWYTMCCVLDEDRHVCTAELDILVLYVRTPHCEQFSSLFLEFPSRVILAQYLAHYIHIIARTESCRFAENMQECPDPRCNL